MTVTDEQPAVEPPVAHRLIALGAPALSPRQASTVASLETQSVKDKPVEPEPVAWRYRRDDKSMWCYSEGRVRPQGVGTEIAEPFYAHPAPTREAIRADEWPIATAPQLDGYHIEAKTEGAAVWIDVFWSATERKWVTRDSDGDWIFYPLTHWRPIRERAGR